MAKITVVGNAVVITSSMKLEDLKTIKKYRPDALILKDDDGDPVYAIGVGPTGNLNSCGAEFSGATHDEEKLATITMAYTGSEDADVKEVVAEQVGASIITLNKLEATLPAVLEEIATEKAAILETITVA